MMATTTLYGGAPLPALAPAVDRLEASRGKQGGWHQQQRTTRRTALGVALGFVCAGLAVLALVSSPTYGIARDARDGEADGAVSTRAEDNTVSKEKSFASTRTNYRLGMERDDHSEGDDEQKLLQKFGDLLPDDELDRLMEVIDSSRIMPEQVFAQIKLDAATMATEKLPEKRQKVLKNLMTVLRKVITMDESTAKLVSLFTEEEVDHSTTTDAGMAIILVRTIDAFRRFPRWNDDDRAAFERASDEASIATWREFKEDLYAEVGLGASPTVRTWNAKEQSTSDSRTPAAPLTGIKAHVHDTEPAPFSKHASAPGLAKLGRSHKSSSHEEKSPHHESSHESTHTPDKAWGFGLQSDASVTATLRNSFDPESVGLPKSFDAREAFPKCAQVLGSVRDQGKCGSCWAVAVVEVMNDRLCVASDGAEQQELSPEYPLACFDAGSGCDGGDVVSTFREMGKRGVPYGGMGVFSGKEKETKSAITLGKHTNTQLSSSSCLPYEFEPCEHPCQEQGVVPKSCPSKCADGSPMSLVYPKSEAYLCPSGDWACIATEISTYGSVAVTFGSVREDFYDYQSGVYRVSDVSDPGLGQHATKLIGWGFDEETADPYWIMMNSWRNWGDKGAGRVGVGEMRIESGVSAVHM